MDIELIKATIKNSVDEAFEPYECDDEMDVCDITIGASGPMVFDGIPATWVNSVVDTISRELLDLRKRQKIVLGAISVNIDIDSAELTIEVPVTCVALH